MSKAIPQSVFAASQDGRTWRAGLAVLCVLPVMACASVGGKKAEAPPAPAPGEAASTATKLQVDPDTRPPGFFARTFGGTQVNAGPCPFAGALAEAARMVEFKGAEAYNNITYTAEITGVRSACRYYGTNPIEIALEIDLAFGKGPAAPADGREYTYWVSVVRRNVAPIVQERFTLPVTFKDGVAIVRTTQSIDKILIPRANAETSGVNFEVLVGLDITPEQVEFNRQGKRFRMGSGVQSGG